MRMALVDRRKYAFQQNSIGEPLPPLSSRAEVWLVHERFLIQFGCGRSKRGRDRHSLKQIYSRTAESIDPGIP